MKTYKNTTRCPTCNKSNIVKNGTRATKRGKIQIYYCKNCNKRFSDSTIKYTTHPPEIIFTAISTYNLGYTILQTKSIINRKFRTKIPYQTIYSWLNRYKDIFTFTSNLRKKYKLDPKTLIYTKKFHHQQVYEFKYHNLKLNIAGKTLPQLKNYIKSISNKCPNKPFQFGPRCSTLRINLKPTKTIKYNNAPKLAELAQTLAKTNRERHTQVENIFLINDTATIAIEIPVYLYPNELTKQEQTTLNLNLNEPLSGHIDILQQRFTKIHILDYKPDAKRNDKATIDQLFLYSLALSKRISIPLRKIVAAFFDENNYFQIQPSEI